MRSGPDVDHTFAHLYVHTKRQLRPRHTLLGTTYICSQKGNVFQEKNTSQKRIHLHLQFFKKHNAIHLVPHIYTSSLYWPSSCFSVHGLYSCMLKKKITCVKNFLLVGDKKKDAYVPGAFIGDEQVTASNAVVDSSFLGNLSIIY